MPKILVVDDSEITLAELQEVLESAEHEVITATNGRAGFNAFEENQDTALIFTDINMPIMNGLEMCEALLKKFKTIPPVLAITTEVNQQLKLQAKKVGIVAWLVKPFDPKTLPSITNQLITKYTREKTA